MKNPQSKAPGVVPGLMHELTPCTLSKAAGYGGWLLFSFAIMQFLFSTAPGGLSNSFARVPILLISQALLPHKLTLQTSVPEEQILDQQH